MDKYIVILAFSLLTFPAVSLAQTSGYHTPPTSTSNDLERGSANPVNNGVNDSLSIYPPPTVIRRPATANLPESGEETTTHDNHRHKHKKKTAGDAVTPDANPAGTGR